MAKHLSDREKKQIIAEYIACGSYNAVAKKYRIADTTVKRIVERDPEMQRKAEQKKTENTKDVLAFLDLKKEDACLFIEKALEALCSTEKIAAAPLSQIATAMGIVIDKFTASGMLQNTQEREDDGLLEALENNAGVWENRS